MLKEENVETIKTESNVTPFNKENLTHTICSFYLDTYKNYPNPKRTYQTFLNELPIQEKSIFTKYYVGDEKRTLSSLGYHLVQEDTLCVFNVFYKNTSKVVANLYTSLEGILEWNTQLDYNLYEKGGINVNFFAFLQSCFKGKKYLTLEELYEETEKNQNEYDFINVKNSIQDLHKRLSFQQYIFTCCVNKLAENSKEAPNFVNDLLRIYPRLDFSFVTDEFNLDSSKQLKHTL